METPLFFIVNYIDERVLTMIVKRVILRVSRDGKSKNKIEHMKGSKQNGKQYI